MSFTLVKLDSNYADEFDVKSFVVVGSEKIPEFIEKAKKITKSFEIGFGTNESLQFMDGNDLLDQLYFEELLEDEVNFFKQFFGNVYHELNQVASYGLCTYFFEYIMFPEDEDFDEEDDE